MVISRLLIDGQNFTDYIIEGTDFVIEIAKDSTNNVVGYTVSSPIPVESVAYFYLYDIFVNVCANGKTKLDVIVELACCDLTFAFEANINTIEFDLTNCYAGVVLVQVTDAIKLYEELRKAVWWQSESFKLLKHPKLKYISEPNWWRQFIGGDFDNSKWHFFWNTPLAYTIFVHNIETLNNKKFKSESVFDLYTEYKRMGITMSTFREGHNVDSSPQGPWLDEMAPVQTTLELLKSLEDVFNATFEITNEGVRFERKDWWRENAILLMDIEQQIQGGRIEDAITLTADTETNYAYGKFEYAEDDVDQENRKVKWLFSDFIEWNPDGDTNRRGERSVQVDFTPLHVVGDVPFAESLINRDDFGNVISYDSNDIRWRIWGDLTNPSSYDIDNDMAWTKDGISSRQKLVILEEEWASTPRQHHFAETEYIYPDPTNPVELPWIAVTPVDARMKRVNWNLSFREDERDGLYQRFHIIDDTRNTVRYNITEFKWYPREDFCYAVTLIIKYGLRIAMRTAFGLANPESIEINFDETSITFKGNTIEKTCL